MSSSRLVAAVAALLALAATGLWGVHLQLDGDNLRAFVASVSMCF
jgi:hypothetical protein